MPVSKVIRPRAAWYGALLLLGFAVGGTFARIAVQFVVATGLALLLIKLLEHAHVIAWPRQLTLGTTIRRMACLIAASVWLFHRSQAGGETYNARLALWLLLAALECIVIHLEHHGTAAPSSPGGGC